jgi:hypothetical protein
MKQEPTLSLDDPIADATGSNLQSVEEGGDDA